MKKWIIALLCALLMTAGAMAEGIELDGTIQPAQRLMVTAPFSGMAGSVDVSAGDTLAAGDALAALSTTKVYADFDGTVTGVFAEAGDSAQAVMDRYGALMVIEREALYTAQCTTSGAASDNENKIVHAGETVYVQSTNNSNREGTAIVTSVSGKSYTLELTQVDDLRLSDSIKVYREAKYDSDSCIGSGKISRIDPVSVTAQGAVLAIHVQAGQTVSRGDLLMEIVPDALEGRLGGDGAVRMPQDGVLLEVRIAGGETVAKDQVLATYCPADAIRLVCDADEEDVAALAVGDELTVTLDALGERTIRAMVEKIGAKVDENGAFAVTMTLEKTDGVMIGMSATATK